MTFDQTKGIIERVVLVALTWAAARGYIQSADVANMATLVLAILGAGYAYWTNRPKAIVQSAAELPATLIVTTPALAAATPDQQNIVSNAAVKVVPK